ncbi:MAG: [protein-PII] uridylyltransferase [Candidatus Poriferisodalaceae bacterium]|jgi:[protein-PII] uridylyltransferase
MAWVELDFAGHRAELLTTDVPARELTRSLSTLVDDWVRELFLASTDNYSNLALIATGGTGRGELCPGSDIDLLLLHKGRRDISVIAEQLWYPLWDAGVKLGHSVRSVKETLALVKSGDLETTTSLLDARHLCGDEGLTADVLGQTNKRWLKDADGWLQRLSNANRERHEALGEVAFLLEPHLKDGRGGLRDAHAVSWAQRAGIEVDPGDVDRLAAAYDVLLAARVALHRTADSPTETLLLQEQDAVAEQLGHDDADVFMGTIATAARTIEHLYDEVWHRIDQPPGDDITIPPAGMTIRGGEVHLIGDPATDPILVLHAAVSAAEYGVRIDRESLRILADRQGPIPDPWPEGARDLFVRLLRTGHKAIPVIEAIDFAGAWVKILPEWEPNRHRPQRNVYHRFTVDRHLLEAAAQAAALTHRVSRPDLLVIGALLHDIGKGYPGDHTEVGMQLIAPIALRMGLGDQDINQLVRLVEHHLLLPDVATRRDVEDEQTIRMIANEVQTNDFLELLAALTEADSKATGPSAWGSWKAELVKALVDHVSTVLAGGKAGRSGRRSFVTPELENLMRDGSIAIVGEGDILTVAAPDQPGLFSRTAGVLAFRGLAVLQADAYSSDAGMAVSQFRVSETTDPIDWDSVAADVDRALRGRLAIDARIAERDRRYRRRAALAATPAQTSIVFDTLSATDATIIEVTCEDKVGVLFHLTQVLADMRLDIRYAKIQTLSHEVVDTFYVRGDEGVELDDEYQAEIERAIRHVLTQL